MYKANRKAVIILKIAVVKCPRFLAGIFRVLFGIKKETELD
jgi:hypothetical protein